MFADKRFKPSSWTTNLLFGDASVMAGGEVRMHPSLGSPGDRVIYVPRNLFPGEKQDCGSEQPSQIVVQVPNADVPNIFAHRQWHAGMILSDLIYSKQLTFHNEIVLELGAGTGLPSISAFRYGEAKVVVATDYDIPPLVARLKENVLQNCPSKTSDTLSLRVGGHIWGQAAEDVSEMIPASMQRSLYDAILMADCIWDTLSHNSLLKSIQELLVKPQGSGTLPRLILVSGLHTGRSTIVAFLRRAYRMGLRLVPFSLRKGSWPSLSSDEEHIRKTRLLALQDDQLLVDAITHIMEMELTPYPDQSVNTCFVSDQRRLTGHRRVFVPDERAEERRENEGVHLRNRWMTFMTLSWSD